MTTKSPTFHVQLFPTTFPPSNGLEAEQLQRSYHRLRSTRRLEAARGPTPLFLNLDTKVDIISDKPTLISPRTRAKRRKGQVFTSPSSPTSSTDSCESDYVVIHTHLRSDLQPHSPSSFCTPSPAGNPVANDNQHNSESGRSGKHKSGDRNKITDPEGPQRLAQPYLLRLRSVPVPAAPDIKSQDPPVNHSPPLSLTSPPLNKHSNNMHSTDMHSTDMHSTDMHSTDMHSTDTVPLSDHDLSEHEKRRKLAKLARTFGENIPPELVFHHMKRRKLAKLARTFGEDIPPELVFHSKPLQRTTSMISSTFRPRPSHKPSPSLSRVSTAPPLLPMVAPTTPILQLEARTEPETPVAPKRRARPQTMAFTTASQTTAPPTIRGESLDRAPTNDFPFQELIVAEATTDRSDTPMAWGRRKEKGWSGEWNVKDMEHVAKALRGLRAR